MSGFRAVVRVVLAGLAAAVPGSCGLFFTPVERIGYAVWSEDDARVGFTWLSYEERTPLLPSDTTVKRNWTYGLFHAAPDGSDVVAVVEERAAIAGSIFFMRDHGYFVVFEYDERGNGARFVRVSLDGEVAVVHETTASLEPTEVIPSPDGATIVVFTPAVWCPDSGDYTADCEDPYGGGGPVPGPLAHEAWVTFLDADSLAPIEQSSGVTQERVEFGDFLSGGFEADGSFVVTDGTDARRFATGAPPAPITVPDQDCLVPPTSSGTVNGAGELIVVEDGGGGFTTEPGHGGSTFGCP